MKQEPNPEYRDTQPTRKWALIVLGSLFLLGLLHASHIVTPASARPPAKQ